MSVTVRAADDIAGPGQTTTLAHTVYAGASSLYIYVCACVCYVFVCLSPTGDGTEKLPANMDAHNADQMPTAAAAASRRTDRRHTTVENWLQVESKQ